MSNLGTTEYSVTDWLQELGLQTYAGCFRAADIDLAVLPHLSDADLKELGVASMGHRRLILAAAQGEKGNSDPPLEPGERRFITVLFCDMVGSTALAETLGEEAFSEVLGRFYSVIEQTVSQFGGHIAQYLGDGAMVYFGSPTPLEDAATRAIEAALQLPELIQNVNNHNQPSIEIRMGVASGFVVLNQENTSSSRAYGATVHLAARLQAQAKPGGVVLGQTTASLVHESFELIPLTGRQIKGFDDPGAIFSVLANHPRSHGWNTKRQSATTAFVNRSDELRFLNQAFAKAQRQIGTIVMIAGEPGIGKSRLVSEFLTQQGPDCCRLLCFRFSSHGGNVPFSAIRTTLEQTPVSQSVLVQGLQKQLRQVDSIPLGASRARRRQTMDAILAFLTEDSGRQPTIIWFDDIQWADPSSLEVLQNLLDAKHLQHMIMIGSRQKIQSWRLTPPTNSSKIDLTQLTMDHTKQLIRAKIGDPTAGNQLVEKLARRANGIPIFAEELANDLGSQAKSGKNPEELSSRPIPSSLHQSVQARIGRLGTGRSLLRLLACINEPCPTEILETLWTGPGLLESAVNEVVEAGFVKIAPNNRGSELGTLEFRHQLVLDCTYDMILSRDRPAIHRAVAETQKAADTNPSILADQFERGNLFEDAAKQWAKAGRIAAAQSADAEAVALFYRALDLVEKIPDRQLAEEFETDTILLLYPVMIGSRGYRSVDTNLTARLEDLIAKTRSNRRIFSAMFFRWLDMVTQGDIDIAHEFSLGLGGIVASDSSGAHQMVLDRMLGSTYVFRGEFEKARIHVDRVLSNYEPQKHGAELAHFGATDNFVTVLTCLTAIEAASGRKPETKKAMSRALSAATNSGHVHSMCHTLAFAIALPAIILENWAELEMAEERLTVIAQKDDRKLWQYFAQMLTGFLLVRDGQVTKGKKTFDAAAGRLVQQGFIFMGPTFRTLFTAMLIKQSPTSVGRETLAELEIDLLKGERWMLPVLERAAALRAKP